MFQRKFKTALFQTLFVLVVTAILATPVHSQPSSKNPPEPSGTLIIALNDMSDVFDPLRVNNNHKLYLSIVFENLVGTDRNGQIKPSLSLAKNWERSPDAKIWTFTLRQGVKFHNGEELTAADVKFSIERMMSPKSTMTYASMFRDLVDRVEVVNPYTARFHLKKPVPDLHRMLCSESYEGFVLPKKYIEEKGDVYFGLHPVGTGPYKVVEIVGGSQIRLEAAYRNHWLHGAARFKNLVYKLVPEELTRIGMIKTGEADVARINADRVEGVKSSGFKVVEDPAAHIPFIVFGEQWRKEFPVSNLKVRQALVLAVNREEIFKHIFYGMGRLSGSITMAKNALGDMGLPFYPYDPQKAKQLLKEAGYPNGFKIKLHSFPTEMFPSLPRTMETIAAYFQQVGVQPEIIPYADYISFRPKLVSGELEGGLHGNDSQARNNPLRAMYLWYNSASRYAQIKSPEMDEWVNKAQSTLDEGERKELIQKIDKYAHENYTFLFALERSIPYVISKKVEPWDMGTLVMDINMENVLMWNSPK